MPNDINVTEDSKAPFALKGGSPAGLRVKTSLTKALILRSLPITLIVVSLLSLLILYLTRQLVVSELERKYDVLAEQVHEDIYIKLNSADQQAEILATNSLVINSLVDVLQRDAYMPVFFRSVKIAGVDSAQVYLADFKGNEIARNETSIALHQISSSWKESVLEQGMPYFSLEEDGLLIAKPVKIGNVPEGAIVVWLNADSVNSLLTLNLYGIQWLWLDSSDYAMYSSSPDLVPVGSYLRFEALDNWYFKDYQFNTYPERIILAEKDDDAFITLNRLLIAVALLAAASVIAVIYGAFDTASGAVATLRRLTENVQQVKTTGELTSFKIPKETTVEMAELGHEINELLQEIDSSTLSRLYVESILNSMNELLVTCDLNGKINTLNAAACSALESMSVNTNRLPITQFFNYSKALDGSQPELSFESTLVLGNGSTRNVSWQRSLIKSEAGDIAGYLFVGTDITTIRSIESQLILKDQAIEAAPSGIIICDANVEDIPIIYANQSFVKITGYGLDELLDKNCRFLQGKETEQDKIDQIRKAVADRKTFHDVILNYRKDGTPFYNELIISPVKDSIGRVTHFLGVTNDVTERVKTQRELMIQKKKAETASEAKGQFLANMSHEIRTPLNGILGMSNLLKDTTLQDEQLHYVTTLQESSSSLLTLINDILDFSKIEAGKMEIDQVQFDLLQLVESTKTIMQIRAKEKGLTLVSTIGKSLPRCWIGDPGRLRQVLINLIGNAIKFTNVGGINLNVSAVGDRTSPNKIRRGNLLFEVSDSGIGIPEDKVSQLFEEFQQLDASRTRKFGGTGLGLAISKKLVELMGGEIWVESKQNRGSVFSFTIGCEPDEELIEPIQASRLKQYSCLFIVRDDAVHAQVQEDLDRLLGRVDTMKTNVELQEILSGALLARQEYQLIVIDPQFIEEHYESFESDTLRKRFPDARLLAVTTAGFRRDAQWLRDFGCKGYLSMPLSEFDVEYAIRMLMVEGIPKSEKWFITKHWLREHQLQFERSSDEISEAKAKERELSELEDLKSLKLTGKHILLVEDNRVNQIVIGEYIKRTGAHYSIANNGKEALQMIDSERFDLLLMDMQMPEMDGIEATSIIRRKFNQAELPIIALTANVLERDRQLCIEIGMNDYLSKPIVIDEFVRIFKHYL